MLALHGLFWVDVQKEIIMIIAHGMLCPRETNPFNVSLTYHQWAPYIGAGPVVTGIQH